MFNKLPLQKARMHYTSMGAFQSNGASVAGNDIRETIIPLCTHKNACIQSHSTVTVNRTVKIPNQLFTKICTISNLIV